MVVVLVDVESPSVLVVVLLSVLFELEGSFTTVVLFSVFFSPGGLTVVVSLFSQAAIRATPASIVMVMYFFMRVEELIATES